MSPFARSLLALAVVALLQGACAKLRRSQRRNLGSSSGSSVSLGEVTGSDVVNLPEIHLGLPDVIITIPNDCNPNGYIPKDLKGTAVIVKNSAGGAPPRLTPVDPNNPQSDVEVSCPVEVNADGGEARCPKGLDVTVYQFCNQRIL